MASVGYWYGVWRYFGDFGTETQPWDEDIASIVQPVFFLATTAVALIAILNGISKLSGKQKKL